VTVVVAEFPKNFRLLHRSDFIRLSGRKTAVSSRSFLVIWDGNGLGYSRLGITASKKSGISVVRNRVKRCIREYFRQHRSLLPDVDLNVIVRRQAAENSAAVLFSELQHIFLQIGSK
jgi:ribonuclease P protein component